MSEYHEYIDELKDGDPFFPVWRAIRSARNKWDTLAYNSSMFVENPFNTIEQVSRMNEGDLNLLAEFIRKLSWARHEHPERLDSPAEGISVMLEELGEIAQAYNDKADARRLHDEALDLMVTAWRFARGDWKIPEEDKEEDAQ